MKIYAVYILTNIRHTVLYVGSTNNLARRIYEHKNKQANGFTKKYNVTKLIYYEITEDLNASLAREKQLKSWRRDKKEALVNQLNPDWHDLFDSIL